jgi:hypothetical protein
LKKSILIGFMIAFILLLSSLDIALAENENSTMPVEMAMQDNMTMPQKLPMPTSMPMDMPMNILMSMPMNQAKMPNGETDGETNVIILQNVTLNIITILNMTFPNAIQP